MRRSQLSELKAMKKQNERLKNIAVEFELDKLTLKESLDILKLKARRQISFVRQSFIRARRSQHQSGAHGALSAFLAALFNTEFRSGMMMHCALP